MLYSPIVYVTTELYTEVDKLKQIHVTWVFSETFRQFLESSYDLNKNLRLDEDERKQMHQRIIEVLKASDYHLKITSEGVPISSIPPRVIGEDVRSNGKQLVFNFTLAMDLKLEHGQTFTIEFDDKKGTLAFFFKWENAIKLHSDKWEFGKKTNLSAGKVTVQIVDKSLIIPGREDPPPKASLIRQADSIEKQDGLYLLLAKKLHEITQVLRDYLEEIKDGDYSSLMLLLGFSFLYGMFHAAGPGHGKALVGSYFLANNRSYSKALLLSLMIGGVHIFSALLFTIAVMMIVNVTVNQALGSSTQVVHFMSGAFIIGIAVFLISKKLFSSNGIVAIREGHHHSTCGCSSCAPSDTTDLGIVISAGIIPCPGTVTIFIFTISLELYLTGFLAALIMSLGMSLVISLTAVAATLLKKGIQLKLPKIIVFTEFVGLIIVLLLGIALVLSSLA